MQTLRFFAFPLVKEVTRRVTSLTSGLRKWGKSYDFSTFGRLKAGSLRFTRRGAGNPGVFPA